MAWHVSWPRRWSRILTHLGESQSEWWIPLPSRWWEGEFVRKAAEHMGRAFDGILGVESQTASWTACVSQSQQLRKCREGWEESSGAKGGKVGVQAVLAGELIHEQGRKCDCANAGHFSSQQSIYNHWMLLPNFSSRSWKGHFRKNRIFPISKIKRLDWKTPTVEHNLLCYVRETDNLVTWSLVALTSYHSRLQPKQPAAREGMNEWMSNSP